jgi:hypothetical protein
LLADNIISTIILIKPPTFQMQDNIIIFQFVFEEPCVNVACSSNTNEQLADYVNQAIAFF